MTNESLPVNVLYDQDKIDENSNIEPALVVPVGTLRTRSNLSHAVGQRLYQQTKTELEELQKGTWRGIPLSTWRQKAPHYRVPTVQQLENKLKALTIENPNELGDNPIDSHIRSILRLSVGIKGFRSNQTQASLGARAQQGIHGEGAIQSLQPVPPHGPNPTTVNIAVQAGKQIAAESKNPVKRWVGLNGR